MEPPSLWLRRLGYALAAILAAVALVILAVHTAPVQRYAMDRVEDYLRANQNIDLRVESLRFNLLTGSFRLRGVRVTSTFAPHLPDFLSIEDVSANLDIMSLVRGLLRVDDAALRDVRVRMIVDEEGVGNLPEPPQAENDEESGIYFLITRLAADPVYLLYEDRMQRVRAELPASRLRMTGRSADLAHGIHFESTEFGVAGYDDYSTRIETIRLRVEHFPESDRVVLEELLLRTEAVAVEVSGNLEAVDDPRLDFSVRARTDLERISDVARLDERFAGAVEIEGEVRGPLSALGAEMRLRGDGITARELRDIAVESRVRWDASSERIEISPLRVDSRPLGVSAAVSLAYTGGTSSVNVDIVRGDVLAISEFLGMERSAASILTGAVDAEWPGLNFARATGGARLELERTRETAVEGALPVSGRLTVGVEGDRADVSVAYLEAPGVRLSGTVGLSDLAMDSPAPSADLSGRLRADVIEAAALMSNLGRFLADESLRELELDGQASVEAVLSGDLDRPGVLASIEAPTLTVGELRDVRVRGAAFADRDHVLLRELAVDWNDQSFTAEGRVGLTGDSPQLDLRANADRIAIPSLLEAMGSELPIGGQALLRAEVSGTVDRPEAEIILEAFDLLAYGEPLGRLQLNAAFRDQVIELRRLDLEKPGIEEGREGRLTGFGSYDLDSGRYRFRAESPGLEFSHLTLPGPTPVRGLLRLNVAADGTPTDPGMEFDLRWEDLEVGEQGLGRVELSGSLEQHAADLRASIPRFNLRADVGVGIEAPYPVDFEVHARNTDLSSLPLGDESLRGTLTLSAEGRGNLEDPLAVRARVRVSHLAAEFRGREIRNDETIEIRYGDGRLTVPSAALASGASRVSLSGVLPLENGNADGRLELEARVDLSDIALAFPPDEGYSAEGTLRLGGIITGSLQRLDPSLEVDLEDGGIRIPQLTHPVERLQLRAGLERGRLTLERLRAEIGSASLDGAADVPLGILSDELPLGIRVAEGPAGLALRVSDFSLGSLAELPEDVEGTISVAVEARSPTTDLSDLSASVRFDRLDLRFGDLVFAQEAPVVVGLEDRVARIESFRLEGPETAIEASGSVVLGDAVEIDVRVDGTMDASILALLVEDVQSAGDMRFQLAMTGTAAEPRMNGFAEFSRGEVSLASPALHLTDLDIRLGLEDDRMEIERFTGEVNGGDLQVVGGIAFPDGELRDIAIDLTAENVFLELPDGLQTASTTALRIRSREAEVIEVGGRIQILEGSFTDPVSVEEQLLEFVRASPETTLPAERDPLLSRLRFNIGVETVQPVVVDNNLAQMEARVNVRVLGTYYEPGLTGRVVLEEGGEIYLRERTYFLERGIVTFASPARIEPIIEIILHTRVQEYDITLRISGDMEDIETTLTSDPSLPEPDIVAILVTGRSLEEVRGQAGAVLQEQTLSLLAGGVAGRLGRGLEELTGLSQVRIEPNLIAAESDPVGRLTVGQDLTRRLGLVYSMNLADSSDLIYIGKYDVTRRFTTQVLHQTSPPGEDESAKYRFEFRHDLRFGETRAPRPTRPERRISQVNVGGEFPVSEREVRDRFGLADGDRFEFGKARRRLDRLHDFFRGRDHLEARARFRIHDAGGNRVRLDLLVEAGPRVQLSYLGVENLGRSVRTQVRRDWTRGVFDAQRAATASATLRRHFVERGYLQVEVDHEISFPSRDLKDVAFHLRPGVRYTDISYEFPGASGLAPDFIRDELRRADLLTELNVSPNRARNFLEGLYVRNGFLGAEIGSPEYRFSPERNAAEVIIPIQEGARSTLRDVAFQGNRAFSDEQLLELSGLRLGEPYRPQDRDEAFDGLRDGYWAAGYTDASIGSELRVNPATGASSLLFRIEENAKSVVQDIRVEGNVRTSDSFIRRQIALSQGDSLDPALLARSRRQLYDMGAFSLVDIEPLEMENPGEGLVKPVSLSVRVAEASPYRLHYGAFYDTERGPGAIADLTKTNTLGNAAILGLRTRYDNEFREGRLYFSQPQLLGLPFKTNLATFASRELRPAAGFISDRLGFSIQQERQFRNELVLSFGYRFEQNRTYEPGPDPFFDITLRVAPLTTALVRDVRDDVLDASYGSFTSHSLEFSPEALGSDLHFIRYFGQYFRYVPLDEPTEIPWVGMRKSRLVYAVGLRLGLARAFGGQRLIRSERFFAGGGTTIRGFEQDGIGPRNILGDPAGGAALFILNNELRFPLVGIFDGVGFLDVGNLYERVTDFNPFDVRGAAGFGLRVRTPYFLVRADYGLKLDRRPEEGRGAFFFSIGQAF
jgi:outer membrane protein assembly complex protein YaeT